MIKIKKGVKMHGLKASMTKPISYLDKFFPMLGVDFVITSAIRPIKGNEKSLHPHGHAIDVRTSDLNHLQKAALLVLLIQYLGNDYDVIEYDNGPKQALSDVEHTVKHFLSLNKTRQAYWSRKQLRAHNAQTGGVLFNY